ncbi:hypothetical protein [Capsulimonas corticalis]|nr:hypothetical protein [Capsulimonas corticalis]
MDIWNSVQWDVLFGYAAHDCSCMILAASALMMALAVWGRLVWKRG